MYLPLCVCVGGGGGKVLHSIQYEFIFIIDTLIIVVLGCMFI